jgi:hypothetical protein
MMYCSLKLRRPFAAVTLLLAGTLALSSVAQAKDKKAKAPNLDSQDAIEVAGHTAVGGGPVTRLLATQHYSRTYLYAEHESGKTVTLLDVTKAMQPRVLGDVAFPVAGGAPNLFAVTGTAALVSDGEKAGADQSGATVMGLRTIRIMDFSDPLQPKITREFTGVTATGQDRTRGLIFVANGDGIWILQQRVGMDPAVEKEYDRQFVYAH